MYSILMDYTNIITVRIDVKGGRVSMSYADDFIVEYSNIQYTKEYYKILKESTELMCMETYLASQKYAMENFDIVTRFDSVFCEYTSMDDIYELTEAAEEKRELLIIRIGKFIRDALIKFIRSIKELFSKTKKQEEISKDIKDAVQKALNDKNFAKDFIKYAYPHYEKSRFVKRIRFDVPMMIVNPGLPKREHVYLNAAFAVAFANEIHAERQINKTNIRLFTVDEMKQIIDALQSILESIKNGKNLKPIKKIYTSQAVNFEINSNTLAKLVTVCEDGVKICDNIIAGKTNELKKVRDIEAKSNIDHKKSKINPTDYSSLNRMVTEIMEILTSSIVLYKEFIGVRELIVIDAKKLLDDYVNNYTGGKKNA